MFERMESPQARTEKKGETGREITDAQVRAAMMKAPLEKIYKLAQDLERHMADLEKDLRGLEAEYDQDPRMLEPILYIPELRLRIHYARERLADAEEAIDLRKKQAA